MRLIRDKPQKRQLRHIFMSAEKLKNLLKINDKGDLGAVVQRAREMGELTETLSNAIPESDRGAIVAANVREDGELIVICASPAWAARLRYETDVLLAAARKAGVKASACRVRVAEG